MRNGKINNNCLENLYPKNNYSDCYMILIKSFNLGHIMRLVLAVLIPVAVLGLLVTVILMVMRHRHRKRMEELNTVNVEYQVTH